ncbi:hypothetical protein Flavo103_12200 [Flavobacterium collinsii]|uniref:hypothetical protein n=1 Tax=Flavobacterium collinsii TaxID=1114861 RepID=UPI0022BF4F2A|nr:hypothetical protein [Flavobacterium collinsii]GIQ58084.1 hypothetical protein Flavo103_12200 [Flavobacterium collinsii]
MKNIKRKMYSALCFWIVLITNAQISTGTGGAPSILPNNPTSNTNVGIGTTNPTSALEVNGSIKAKAGIFTNSMPNGSIFSSYDERSAKCLVFSGGGLLETDPNSNIRMLRFYDFPQSNLDPKSLLYLVINDRAGNERYRFSAVTGGFTQMLVSDKSKAEIMKIYDDGNENVFVHFPKANSRVVIGNWGNYLPEHKFVVSGSAKIEGNILTDSNIGIGTSNFTDGATTYRLSVKGKIRAEEVKVYNTWADYVFAKDYKLSTLKEVEKYILKNGHLPNVASAKEITEKGLELGEMTKIQQEKIEELTLYLIQQNKEIEVLKSQVKLLLATKK